MGLIILTITVMDGFGCASKLFASTQSWLACSSDGGIEFWQSQRNNGSISEHIVEVTLASLYTFSRFSLSLSYATFDMGQFALVFSLWVAVDDFCTRHVQSSSTDLKSETKGNGPVLELSGIQDVIFSLQDIHSYSELINQALCDRMAFFLFATSFFYPLNFSQIIPPEILYESISFGVSFTFLVTLLVTAADVKSKVQNGTEELMIQNYRNGTAADYNLVLSLDSLRNGIEIRGNESFEVTYSFLGNVRKLIVSMEFVGKIFAIFGP